MASSKTETAEAPRAALPLLFLGSTSVALGQTAFFTVLLPLGREIGLHEVQIGAIISASSIVFFFGSSAWGRVSDHWGRKPVLLVGLLGYTLGTLVFASGLLMARANWLTPLLAFAFLVAARMGQSALMSATPPASTAYVADITHGAARTRGLGLMGAAQNTGSILGPGVAGLLVGFGMLVPVYFASACTAAAAVAIAIYLPPAPRKRPGANNGKAADNAKPAPPIRFTDPRIFPFLIAGVVLFTGFSLIQQTLPYRLQDSLGLDGPATANLFGATMIVSAMASLFSQIVLVRRFASSPVVLLRLAVPVVLAAFVILVSYETRAAFFVAMIGMGLGMGMAGPGFIASVSLAVGAEAQGRVAGYTSACPPLGFTFGPLAGAWLYGFEPTAPYLLGMLLYGPLLLFVLRLRQHVHED